MMRTRHTRPTIMAVPALAVLAVAMASCLDRSNIPTFRSIGSRVVGTTMRWEVELRTDDGLPVVNHDLRVLYVEKYVAEVPSIFNWPMLKTDSQGIASVEVKLPTSTAYYRRGLKYSHRILQHDFNVAWLYVNGWVFPDFLDYGFSDTRPLLPGPPTILEVSMSGCEWVYALGLDSYGNVGNVAPTISGPPGAIDSVFTTHWAIDKRSEWEWEEWEYKESLYTWARLAPGQDSITLTATVPGLPPKVALVKRGPECP